MIVPMLYERLVGYVVEETIDAESNEAVREPIGTLFFVEHSVGPGAGVVRYAITCRHVLEEFKRHEFPKSLFVRINNADGFAEDTPITVDDWVLGEDVDIAVARVTLPPQNPHWAYPVERGQTFGLFSGMNVFFIGMFSLVPGFVSVQAVVRTGTIARTISEVPLCFKENPQESTACVVHLVEMRSFGGESGSPVFFYDERLPVETPVAFNPGYGPGNQTRPALLGVLHGQFEIDKSVTRGQEEVGLAQLNSGIGIVVPLGAIIATLNTPSLVDDRNRIFEERKAQPASIPRPD